MKRVRINAGYVGLVFRNGDYQKVLAAGVHWVYPWQSVRSYNMAQPFIAPVDLDILLRDEALKALLNVVEVKDAELVVQFEKDVFKAILSAGRYVFWKGLKDYKFVSADTTSLSIPDELSKATLTREAFVPYIRVSKVESYESAILFVDNKKEKVLGPGEYYFWKNATALCVEKVDLRQQQFDVVGQEILTKDKAALRINFGAQYRVVDVEKALVDNKDFERQLYVQIQMALRGYVGAFSLDELLAKRDEISSAIQEMLSESVSTLGVELMACGVKDIILPGEVKDILNQVLIAQKRAEANVITRREETASTRSLLNTAKLMEDNAMLLKLKEMEYVEKIADKINTISLSGGSQILDQLRDIFTPSST